MSDLQKVGANALTKAPQPLRRALGDLGVQFRGENGPVSAMAGGLGPGNKSVLAGVQQGSPNTISVLDPQSFAKAPAQLATHEGMHLWQNNLPPSIQKSIPADNPNDPYNYGGTAGVKSLLSQGKGLANMPREQAAAAMQYGQVQGMPEPYNQLAHTMDTVPLSQVDMTDPMAKTINMHPRAPQVPPSSVPGMNFAKEIYQPGQPAPGDTSLLPPDMQPQPTDPMAGPVAPDPLQQNIASNQQQLQKVEWHQANPYGTANNHPGTLGKIAHVLSVAGNVAGDIFAPAVTANIPGSELNMQRQHSNLANTIDEETGKESENQGRDATTQATQLANAAEPEKTRLGNRLTQAEIDKDTAEGQPKAITLQQAHANAVNKALAEGRDPSTDPTVNHLADAITSLQKQPAESGVGKTTDIQGPDGKVHTMGYNPATKKFDIDEGPSGFKPAVVNVNAGLGALDRETKQFGAPHQKAVDTANAQLEKIADARAMINGNAEAQGLGIPKVLTALVGGQGTGVRITQAELTSIAHARGLQGDVEGTLNKLSGKGALSHQQQIQLTQIMDDVKARLLQKQAIAASAVDSINGASTREQIIQADKDARKKLNDLENGGSSPSAAPSTGGAHYKYVPGKGLVAQ